jgi:hypothetical protein
LRPSGAAWHKSGGTVLAVVSPMTRFLAVACAAAVLLGCSGKSEGNGGKGAGAGTAGDGGTANAQGGTATAGSGALAGRNAAGGSGGGGASSGSAGKGSGSGGTGGGSAGGAGSANGGASGRAGGSGGVGASGAGGGGRGGSDEDAAGAAGASGMRCGGMEGITCASSEYCDFNGSCTLGDAEGVCRSTGTETCSAERVCGCDGKIYTNDCRAHSAGVDVTSSSHCVTGNGAQGAPCVLDDDCTGDLKCCSSPIGIVSCTPAMGNGCPLTP